MAKIAVEQNGITSRLLAAGEGWTVSDVVCRSGPLQRPFEEQHTRFQIAIVSAGTFQYRSSAGRELMTPGSLLLGNPGQCFECGHEHAAGDRCISFGYTPEFFENLGVEAEFRMLRLPPLRELSGIISRACAAARSGGNVAWRALGIELAVRVAQLAHRHTRQPVLIAPAAEARVTRVVRRIEADPDGELSLEILASEAGLSPFHFLRTFEQVTGLTPHQYVRRARLREAAKQLATQPDRILDVALDCGFGDVSNFNRAFHAEFGVSPRAYRSQAV